MSLMFFSSVNVLFPFVAFMVEDMGYTGSQLGYHAGLMAASFCGAQFCTAVPWGMLSDRFGRKPMIIVGTIGSGMGMLVFGLARTFPQGKQTVQCRCVVLCNVPIQPSVELLRLPSSVFHTVHACKFSYCQFFFFSVLFLEIFNVFLITYGVYCFLLCSFSSLFCFVAAVAARLFSGLLSGNLGVVKSLLTEVTDDTNRGAAFAYMSVAWAIGCVIAPLAGGMLSKPAEKYPSVFSQGDKSLFVEFPYLLPCLICVTWSMFSALWCIIFMKETRFTKRPSVGGRSSNKRKSTRKSGGDGGGDYDTVSMMADNSVHRGEPMDGLGEPEDDDFTHGLGDIEMAAYVSSAATGSRIIGKKHSGGEGAAHFSHVVQEHGEHLTTLEEIEQEISGTIDEMQFSIGGSSHGGYASADAAVGAAAKFADIQANLRYSMMEAEMEMESSVLDEEDDPEEQDGQDGQDGVIREKGGGVRKDEGVRNPDNSPSTATSSTAAAAAAAAAAMQTSPLHTHTKHSLVHAPHSTSFTIENDADDEEHDVELGRKLGNKHTPVYEKDVEYFEDEEEEEDNEDEVNPVCCASRRPLMRHGHSALDSSEHSSSTAIAHSQQVSATSSSPLTSSTTTASSEVVGLSPSSSSGDKNEQSGKDSVATALRRRNVLLTTGNYGVLCMAAILMEETIPLFLKAEVKDGGYGFNSGEIGSVLSISGVVMLVFSSYFLPVISRQSKAWMFNVGAIGGIPIALSMPFFALINKSILVHLDSSLHFWILWTVLPLLNILKSVFMCLAFGAVMIQVCCCLPLY
jgi:MFS family permease